MSVKQATPQDANLLAEAGGFATWSIDPILASFAATQANTHLVGVWLKAGQRITGIAVPVTVAGVTLTLARVGIYDANGNLLVSSPDNLAGFQGIGWIATNFASVFTVPASGLYYLASGFTGTTLPTVLNFQQTAALSTGFPGTTKPRAIHAQVPGATLPNPAVSQGTFTNVPCLAAY
jgi:hypothetical protein